jgi:hypothetical protein
MNNRNQLVNIFAAIGVAIALLVTSIASAAHAADVAPRIPAAPADAPQFNAGDTLTIATDAAQMMRGAGLVATVPKGQRFTVVEVRGPWIGTQLLVGGQQRLGWIADTDVVSVPQAYAVYKPVEMTAAAARYTSVCRVYSDDYLYGYYVRHETDPDMHAWEPWRGSQY